MNLSSLPSRVVRGVEYELSWLGFIVGVSLSDDVQVRLGFASGQLDTKSAWTASGTAASVRLSFAAAHSGRANSAITPGDRYYLALRFGDGEYMTTDTFQVVGAFARAARLRRGSRCRAQTTSSRGRPRCPAP